MSTWNSTLKRGTSQLKRSPMKRGSGALRRSEMKRGGRRKQIVGHHDRRYTEACRGESCYLTVRGVCAGVPRDPTVVPCHGNWSDTGKGAGLKAADRFTVPGCSACHYWLDFGTTATREEKREVFFNALARWEPVRTRKLNKGKE